MKKKTTRAKSTVTAKRSVSSRATTKKATVSRAKKTQPKGLKHHAKRLYRMTPKFIHGMVAGAFVGIVVVTSLGVGSQANALDIPVHGDCDAWSIIHCGVQSSAEINKDVDGSAYIAAVYKNAGISGAEINDLAKNAVKGIVYRSSDGSTRVEVGGTVVATDLSTAARLRINASDKVHRTTHGTFFTRHLKVSWSRSSESAYVLMKDGVFQFAIMSSCGNPVTGKPKLPPATPPKKIKVCDLATYKVVTINEDDYDSALYSKDTDDCSPPPPPVMIKVCELKDYKIVTIDEDDFDAALYSRDIAHCAPATPPVLIQVCNLGTYQIITINENDFDSDHYSKDITHCAPPVTPPPTVTPPTPTAPTALPNTGPGAVFVILGLAIVGGYVFHIKHLHSKHKRHATHHSH